MHIERKDESTDAGKPAKPEMLVNVPKLVAAYFTEVPDPSVPEQQVLFGTSGHRGSSFKNSCNENHILALGLGRSWDRTQCKTKHKKRPYNIKREGKCYCTCHSH